MSLKVKVIVDFKTDDKLPVIKKKVEESLMLYKNSVALGTHSVIASVVITEEVPTKLYEGTFNSNIQALS